MTFIKNEIDRLMTQLTIEKCLTIGFNKSFDWCYRDHELIVYPILQHLEHQIILSVGKDLPDESKTSFRINPYCTISLTNSEPFDHKLSLAMYEKDDTSIWCYGKHYHLFVFNGNATKDINEMLEYINKYSERRIEFHIKHLGFKQYLFIVH